MIITKLKLNNFKRFKSQTFAFNSDINLIVGDNESGKSSLLEAMDICLNYSYRGRPLSSELTTGLFNAEAVIEYIESDKTQDKLPEILIEAYLSGGDSQLKGTNNTEGENCEGIFVKISFDTELVKAYADFTKEPDKVKTVPVEFYKIERFSFAWDRVTQHNKSVVSVLIDPTRIHPTLGRTKYINTILSTALSKEARSALNLNYRQIKVRFDEEEGVKNVNAKLDVDQSISHKKLKVTADLGSASSWENGLQLTVDDIAFDQIGKGEQNQIQIKLALREKANDVHIVMLEEPENHLSHINLARLVSYIEKKHDGKQLFITTHSSFILNKLNISKICLLLEGQYQRLTDIDVGTVNTLKRLPGYDTLRIVLAKKIILVEGPSDELVIRRIFETDKKIQPESKGIDIIVVRGIGFKNYLSISKQLRNMIHVVKDNDGDYTEKITKWSADYSSRPHLSFHSPTSNEQHSLEPALMEANASDEASLDSFAKIILSIQTFNLYAEIVGVPEKKKFIHDWFTGEASGSKKVDSAMRLFESTEVIKYPQYLIEAANFE